MSTALSMLRLLEEILAVKKTLLFVIALGLKPTQLVHRKMWNTDGIDSDYNPFLNSFDSAYTLNTSGCTVPKLKSNDHTIRKFIHPPRNIEWCPARRHPLLHNNHTHIWVATENIVYYNIKIESELNCCYRSVNWSASQYSGVPNEFTYLDCITFVKVIEASDEFVKVECFCYGNVIHRQFFIFVPKVNFTERQELASSVINNNTKFNVLILGLSSMSRLNAHRTMPKTFELLTNLGAIELIGYHAIGDGTFDNIMPILTNMIAYEFNVTCWPFTQDMTDICPFIWERFKDSGYVTALIQDTAHSGIFDTEMYGFRDILPDYYIHHFINESERNESLKYGQRTSKKKKRRRNSLKRGNLNLPAVCKDDNYYFNFLLDYVERLTEISRSSKLFGFVWESSLSHNLNAPMLMDVRYEKLIRKLNDTGYLNETVLILLSDEGMSHGGIQATKQGRLEQRLPLASILVPPAFREQYNVAYETLKINSKRLTTPFDLHETLVDLIDLSKLENNTVLLNNQNELSYERGISLLVPIKSDRTCESAGISNYWCTCHRKKKINIHRNIVKNAVEHVVTHLNWLLGFYPQCAILKLQNIIEFEELWPSYRKEIEWREFRAEIRVAPGSGEYEAFLRLDVDGWSLLAHVQRLDIFNEPDDCVADDFIKWYCQCKTDERRLTPNSHANVSTTIHNSLLWRSASTTTDSY